MTDAEGIIQPYACRVTAGNFTWEAALIEVRLDETDRLEHALKLFKRKVQKAGLLRELRQRRHYLKPSAARQLKAAAARRRQRRNREQ